MPREFDAVDLVLKRIDSLEDKIDSSKTFLEEKLESSKNAQDAQNRAVNERLELQGRTANERIMQIADALHKEGNIAHKLILDVGMSVDRNTDETAKISKAMFGDGSENSGAIDRLRELWRQAEADKVRCAEETEKIDALWADKERRDEERARLAEDKKELRRSKIYIWTSIVVLAITTFVRELIAAYHGSKP